jgi:hypothetical protein
MAAALLQVTVPAFVADRLRKSWRLNQKAKPVEIRFSAYGCELFAAMHFFAANHLQLTAAGRVLTCAPSA